MKRSPHLSSEWGDYKPSNSSKSVPHAQIESNNCSKQTQNEQYIPPYLNPRKKIQWWRDHGAGANLLSAIQLGVKPTLTALPPANSRKCPRAPPLLNEAIAEYLALGVLRRTSLLETQSTRHWSLVFGRRKADSGKIRMMTDLRQLNSAWVHDF